MRFLGMLLLAAVVLSVVLAACSDGVLRDGANGSGDHEEPDGETYANPVMNRDFPDPTVIKGPDGWYYAYATETMIDAQPYNIQVARSQDLMQWIWEGDALPGGVAWAAQGRAYWAPHVLYDAERTTYYMYFSAHHDVRNGKCLAVATSDEPLGPFESTGDPLLCGEGFVEIDPMAFDDPASGKKLLYWGSGFEPIRVQELADDRLGFKEGTEPAPVVYPGRDASYDNLVEGAWVIHRDSAYFLFYSGDNCCGDAANYAVMVARADDPFGPFQRLGEVDGTGHSFILEADGTWLAPGHNSVVQDAEGNDWMFYHAIDRDQPRRDTGIPGVQWDRRVMLMEPILYLSGWPRVDGRHPSETAPAPAVN